MKYFFFFLALLLGLVVSSQSVYKDAVILKRYLNKATFHPGLVKDPVLDSLRKVNDELKGNDTTIVALVDKRKSAPVDTLANIFRRYFGEGDINTLLDSNPFLKDFNYTGEIRSLDQKTNLLNLITNKGGLTGLLDANALPGSASFANTLIIGTADFIVKRTKQELNLLFFEKFQKALTDNGYLRLLFPKTNNALKVLGDEIFNFERYLALLQSAFVKDILSFEESLPQLIEQNRVFTFENRALAAAFRTAFQLAGGLKETMGPSEWLSQFTKLEVNDLEPNLGMAVKTTAILSDAVGITSTPALNNAGLVSPSELQDFLRDTTGYKLFMGLLYEVARKKPELKFQTAKGLVSLQEKLHSLAAAGQNSFSSVQLTSYLKTLSLTGNQVIKQQNTSLADFTDSAMVELFRKYADESMEFVEHAVTITDIVGEQLPQQLDSRKTFLELNRSATEIGVNIRLSNYTSAVALALQVLDLTLMSHPGADSLELAKFRTLLFQYGMFMASVAQAKTPKDVERAIELFALPAGSSRIKRNSPFNVSLNAYAGLFVGIERVPGLKNENKFNTYGVSAPIGVAVSWGKRGFLPCMSGNWSHSIFVSILDLGAVTAYRFNNNTQDISSVPEMQLKHILSPGAFWSVGIPKTPISLNFGYQVGPLLRNLSSTAAQVADNKYTRFTISANVDIPLLNLYTK